MERRYQLGRALLEIRTPKGVMVPENLKKFECSACDGCDLSLSGEQGKPVHEYLIQFAESLREKEKSIRTSCPDWKEIYREDLSILTAEKKECRILRFRGMSAPYAISLEEEGMPHKVWIEPKNASFLKYDTVFASLLSLEKLMMKYDSMILHSAYMLREGKAILFSAPSETGKSTQADLWQKYRGTRTINGDRSLLIREEDGWYAHGWPICGSSEICHNEAYPIQAIVMLHQAKTNEVRKLEGMEAVQRLMPQITINMWNVDFLTKVMDKIERILSEIPVYELGCTISEEAVQCLEKVL